jgi:tol-pal system protein YbgF
MRQAGLIRYGVVVTLLVFSMACGQFPGMRTNMPPVPAEAPPGAAAPYQSQAPASDLARQVRDLQGQVQQMESRIVQLEGKPATTPTARPQAVSAPSTPAPQVTAKPGVASTAAENYVNEGMRAYQAKKYGEARTQFYNYLKTQPKGPRAPEARYYLADSFFLEGKYREAGVEFNKLGVQFPKSVLAPAGLLRQALSYRNQQQMSNYRSTLNKLIKAYPNSAEAKEAQKLLKESPKAASRNSGGQTKSRQ